MTTNEQIHTSKLFTLSCFALLVTSMTFAIRAGILGQLGMQYDLSSTELGWINSMAFLGFPLSMLVGGMLYNAIGARTLLYVAFTCHLLGLVMTMAASGFWGLLISTFLIGLANGAVEAGCNPMIAQLYPEQKTKMLNRFHVWFPGGIVIGALISKVMTDMGLGWQLQIATMLVPTFIYGYLTLKEQFPSIQQSSVSTSQNSRAMLTPLFIFMCFCMTLTATTELGTQQWIEKILGASGASPMVILALITGIMALGRYFAGPIIHRLNPTGVLLGSSIITTIAVFMMSYVSGANVYFAAILFAIGVTYFWPTMVGFVAEYLPQTGAIGMSVIGAAGMFGLSIWNPIIGSWIDNAKLAAETNGFALDQIELIAGQSVLSNLSLFPLILVVCFSGLFVYIRKSHTASSIQVTESPNS